MTGYQDQWRRRMATDGDNKRPPSRVLFSWRQAPPGAVFMDFNAWHIVLNWIEVSPQHRDRWFVRPLSNWEERQIWKRSWPRSAWLKAARGTASVQAVVPELDLATADELWCRDKGDRDRIVRLGFDANRSQIRRLRADR